MVSSPELASAIAATCRASSGPIATTLSRILGGAWQISESACQPVEAEAGAKPAMAGPGLLMQLGGAAGKAVIVVREPGEILPKWLAEPNASQVNLLKCLAQAVMLLTLPEIAAFDSFRSERTDDLAASATKAGTTAGHWVVLEATKDGQPTQVALHWDASASPGHDFTGSGHPFEKPSASKKWSPLAKPQETAADLPMYPRSLLMIKLPVKVTLASKKQPIGRIVELGPGSIIYFNKSCEEMLDLEVGGQAVALGEPVKVGDKFGIRLTSIKPPQERFHTVTGFAPRPFTG
jgi:flagellar motor switch protein FliN/FliY